METGVYTIGCDIGAKEDEKCVVILEQCSDGKKYVSSFLLGEEADCFYEKYLKRYHV